MGQIKKMTETIFGGVKRGLEMVNGGFLTSNRMRHELKYIFFVFILVMAYVNNHYNYDRQLRKRDELRIQAEDMKYRTTDIRSKLTTKGQRTQLLIDLENLGSTVTNAQTQPIIVKKK